MLRRTGTEDEALASEARRIVRVEMERRDFNFKRLAAALEARDGQAESVQTLINKINRGRFSFAFMLRICRAMGMSSVDVSSLPPARQPVDRNP